MKHLKKLVALALTVALLLPALFAFAQNDLPIIGIVQIVEHPSLDASRQGFLDELAVLGYKDGENIKVEYHNAQGSKDTLATIADNLVANNATLVLAIATDSALMMASKTTTIPILGTAITDYVDTKLAESNEKPGHNVSGTTDMASIADQLDVLLELVPDAKTIGLLYTASESNSVIRPVSPKSIWTARALHTWKSPCTTPMTCSKPRYPSWISATPSTSPPTTPMQLLCPSYIRLLWPPRRLWCAARATWSWKAASPPSPLTTTSWASRLRPWP